MRRALRRHADLRRNTQTFTYDDLYRLIRVQYNLPAPATSNGGEINYRYDRIGNKLSQTSVMVHLEKGLSVTDLGTMHYGGDAASSNRQGRGPNDPPGPHALTQIGSSSLVPRLFPYDANGNMTELDGLKCTWDFKDRLVAIEDDTIRAEYLYDHTDRRILKKVWPKTPTNSPASALHLRPTSVAYVGKHFEVREHDEPVKYVFNGDTRVARITGSLSTNNRIQRLRLYPGWNLVALAVTAPDLLHQLSGGASSASPLAAGAVAFRWNPATGDYSALADGHTVPAGTVLWIKSTTNTTIALTGSYVEPTNRLCAAGGSFQPGAGLEVLSLTGLSTNMALWHHDASSQTWQIQAPVLPDGFPKFMAPGSAIFVQADVPAELQTPVAALRMRYYHQDHLGSSSVITDGSGAIVEETAYYPFGAPRHDHRPRQIAEPYKFTQKEQDAESGLSYFESRFLASSLSRFIRVDPLASRIPAEWLALPQKLNIYGYVQNNPLRWVDPTGMDGEKPKAAQPKTQVLVMYGDDMYEHFRQQTGGQSRAAYENALRHTYKEEAGNNANIVVQRVDNIKEAGDLTRIFQGGKYDVIVYNGHGGSRTKEIFPAGNLRITPQDIHDALTAAKITPKKMFFYGCNTAESGFVRVLSELQPKAEITGAGTRIGQGVEWDESRGGRRANFRVKEDRDHNIVFSGGKETLNVRKVSDETLKNATLPRP
jgi:RHS repeat-associated protein